MKPCYVGIDTSNYTTSVALCDAEGRVIANLKRPLPVKSGERGLRQSDAVFEHVRGLPELFGKLRANYLADYTPVGVGVSVTPRDAEGSYMPCFLSGKSAAVAFAAGCGAPLHEFSHQSGHIMAALYSAGRTDLLEGEQFIAFHVSGGTTEALLVRPRENGFDVELVGWTDDINAGQAIDRTGVAMGLDFPCGARLEALASEYSGKIHKHPVCVREGVCSLSGVENIAKKLYENGESKEKIAAFTFDFIQRTLCEMAEQAIEKYGKMPILFAGGVMSNKLMRTAICKRFEAYFAEPEFSADNAAGVALLCRRAYMK